MSPIYTADLRRDALQSGAVFSEDRVYRWLLWRLWGEHTKRKPRRIVAFIGLNCSTATETENDPTVTRCINYARAWGFGGMFMLNAFAFRATDPRVMKAAANPVGVDNDKFLLMYAGQVSELVVACWGNHVTHRGRGEKMRELLAGRTVHCLGVNKSGEPVHPLYQPANVVPQIWRGEL